MMLTYSPVAAFALFAVGACTPVVEPADTMALAGSEWGFADATDRFVQFGSDTKVGGSGGCNTFGGSYSQNGATLRIGPLAVTRMACPEPIMSNESAFLADLEQTRSADISFLTLVLKDADGGVLATLQRRDPD
jgi:putative lipoprotein